MKYFNVKQTVFSLLLSATFVATVPAKENQLELSESWGLVLSGLLIWTPKFIGSDKYEVKGEASIDGHFRLSEYSTLFVNNSGVGLNFQRSDHWHLGIRSNVRPNQDRSNIKYWDGLSNIDEAFELGPYLSYQINERLEMSVSGLFDVSETHHGWVANLNLSHKYMIPKTSITMTSLFGIDYANKNYNNTYYGVKPLINGIPIRSSYGLGSGFNSASFGSFFSYPHSDNIALIGSISAIAIIGAANNSPIIKQDTLISVGLGVAYTF